MTKVANTMDSTTYARAVLETESKPKSINFGPMTLALALQLAIETSKVLDQVKRAIYYGKDIDQKIAMGALETIAKLSNDIAFPVGSGRYRDPRDADFYPNVAQESRQNISLDALNVRLLHAALGLQTESGEFIEALMPTLFGGPLDKVNLLEELGDGPGWYAEVALDELGFTREQCNFTNIKKLQDKRNGRYKKGAFDPNAAVQRDTAAERGLLEDGASSERKAA
jgi:hypothetical protein